MSGQGGRDEDQGMSDDSQQGGEQHDNGRSGEGAASAMHHMISQSDRKRHQSGDARDATEHAQ